MKYRKKPVVIEAWQFKGNISNTLEPTPTWVYSKSQIHFYTDEYILIDTLEGQMRADINDWLIQGVKGEIYPCKPDIFEATYELVNE